MAAQEQHYLDLQGLTTYDTLIKAEIPEPDNSTIVYDTNGKLKAVNSGSTPYISGTTLIFPSS